VFNMCFSSDTDKLQGCVTRPSAWMQAELQVCVMRASVLESGTAAGVCDAAPLSIDGHTSERRIVGGLCICRQRSSVWERTG